MSVYIIQIDVNCVCSKLWMPWYTFLNPISLCMVAWVIWYSVYEMSWIVLEFDIGIIVVTMLCNTSSYQIVGSRFQLNSVWINYNVGMFQIEMNRIIQKYFNVIDIKGWGILNWSTRGLLTPYVLISWRSTWFI